MRTTLLLGYIGDVQHASYLLNINNVWCQSVEVKRKSILPGCIRQQKIVISGSMKVLSIHW